MQGMLKLMEIRQAQPAFHPNAHQAVLSVGYSVFAVLRSSKALDGQRILAVFNVSGSRQTVAVGAVVSGKATDLVSGAVHASDALELEPYQVCWLSF
jgi:sucrose phosphorylase